MKRVPLIVLASLFVFASLMYAGEAQKQTSDSGAVNTDAPAVGSVPDHFAVTYFHATHRCSTCRKLEAFAEEAVSSAFKGSLEDSTVQWRVVNFEQEGNEHFVKDYQLYSQALIVSRITNGKEVNWRNLDKIWELVGDKEDFINYVQTQVRDFMAGSSESGETTSKAPVDKVDK